MTILVTGGAGFIGSNFLLQWVRSHDESTINLDKLTYAGNLSNLTEINADSRYVFIRGDIGDKELVGSVLAQYQPRAVINFASDTDRAMALPADSIHTNLLASFTLLETIRSYWTALPVRQQEEFRFLHVSCDEVYGSLGEHEVGFTEASAYQPETPLAASKACFNHLVRAYHLTYGLPTLVTASSSNYGPYHFSEALVPLTIANALAGRPVSLPGNGQRRRDWLYVQDHCAALQRILTDGAVGQTYNIGGASERSDIDVIKTICRLLDVAQPRPDNASYQEQIRLSADQTVPGRRHRVLNGKIERELGWKPEETFESGMEKTVHWYLHNRQWASAARAGARWMRTRGS